MSAYLSADELAELIGCRPNSRAAMKRWLTKNGWPYVVNTAGFPKVSRAFHDAKMMGAPAAVPENFAEPDFSRFE